MKLFIFTLLLRYTVQCANILFVGMYPSLNHQSYFQPIWKELSLKGHQVVALTPNPIGDPGLINLTEIDLSEAYHIAGLKSFPTIISKDLSSKDGLNRVFELMEKIVIKELMNPEVRILIADKRRIFDVVIVEVHYPALFAFSTKFKCPLITISSFGTLLNGHDAMGNPTHPALYPDLFYHKKHNLSFWERLEVTYYGFWFRYFYKYDVLSKADAIAKKFFGIDTPYIGDIEKNISILLLNVNPVFYTPRPNVPGIVHLGHIYVKSDREISKDLKKELDDAKEGVIYLSLGTALKSTNLSLQQRNIILKDLSELPYKILWKWEADHLPGQPENFIIRKWVPQQAVLADLDAELENAYMDTEAILSNEESNVDGINSNDSDDEFEGESEIDSSIVKIQRMKFLYCN
ncbi:UDP-glucosyltransferase [Holotrichia oblita]|uniref:UDP-glucosyltransferase n=1 Tax=Holotrichia oblita TaxID=644536 RepID=A0ACB9TMH1_HOLOL|nr:UDP-glucosyltransferase [Holotrichia oblita]